MEISNKIWPKSNTHAHTHIYMYIRTYQNTVTNLIIIIKHFHIYVKIDKIIMFFNKNTYIHRYTHSFILIIKLEAFFILWFYH